MCMCTKLHASSNEQYNTCANILRVPTDAIGGLSSVPISNRWWFLEKPLFCIYRFKDWWVHIHAWWMSSEHQKVNETRQYINRVNECAYFFPSPFFFGRRTEWMFGRTPPWAMVTEPKSLFNSSSFLTASWMCLGTILDFLLSRAALPASSRISAVKYSRMAARYTGAPAPTRVAYLPFFKNLPILPTGNWSPALEDLEVAFFPAPLPPFPPFPDPAIVLIKLFVSLSSSTEKLMALLANRTKCTDHVIEMQIRFVRSFGFFFAWHWDAKAHSCNKTTNSFYCERLGDQNIILTVLWIISTPHIAPCVISSLQVQQVVR